MVRISHEVNRKKERVVRTAADATRGRYSRAVANGGKSGFEVGAGVPTELVMVVRKSIFHQSGVFKPHTSMDPWRQLEPGLLPKMGGPPVRTVSKIAIAMVLSTEC